MYLLGFIIFYLFEYLVHSNFGELWRSNSSIVKLLIILTPNTLSKNILNDYYLRLQ